MPAWVIPGNGCHGSTNTRLLLIRLLKRHIRGRWRSKKRSEILSSSPSLVNHTFQLPWYTKRQVYKAVFTRHELKKYCGYSLHTSHMLWTQHGMAGSSKDDWEILHFPPIVWWQIYRNSAPDYQGTWNTVIISLYLGDLRVRSISLMGLTSALALYISSICLVYLLRSNWSRCSFHQVNDVI